jgi:cytochrome c5
VKRALLAMGFACAVATQGCGGGRPRGPMSDGERTYRAKCAACHRLHEPGERTKEQWESAIAKMQRLKKVHLSQADEDLILSYLAGSQLSGRSGDAPAPETRAP